jgi:hypothetical protein
MILVILTLGCTEYNYYKEVEKGLENGVRTDSLFMGYYFGMPRQSFYDYSWELNKKQLVTHGEYNQSIEYDFEYDSTTIRMNFYPQFEEGEISQMVVVFSHPAWAPWSKQLWSDKLILKVRELIEDWNDIELKLIRDGQGTPGFVGIKNNQRILITLKDDEMVNLLYTDLSTLQNPLDSLLFNKKYE